MIQWEPHRVIQSFVFTTGTRSSLHNPDDDDDDDDDDRITVEPYFPTPHNFASDETPPTCTYFPPTQGTVQVVW